MRVSANEVYAVKHAVFIVLQTENNAKQSVARNFIVSYPSENLVGVGHKLNLREAGIQQPMFILKNLDDSAHEIMRRVSDISVQGHVIYEAVTPEDACAACQKVANNDDLMVYAIDPRIEHSDLLDILRECEAA